MSQTAIKELKSIIAWSTGTGDEQYDNLDATDRLKCVKAHAERALASLSHTMGVKGLECHCTKIEQDETCPVGYPSLLCEDCDGKGYVPDVKLDGPELWEIVFGIATEAAHEITDEQYSKIAEAINTVFIRSALTPTQQPVGVGWFVRMETAKKVIWHSQDSREDAERYAKSHSTYGGKAMQLYAAPPALAALNAEVSKS